MGIYAGSTTLAMKKNIMADPIVDFEFKGHLKVTQESIDHGACSNSVTHFPEMNFTTTCLDSVSLIKHAIAKKRSSYPV